MTRTIWLVLCMIFMIVAEPAFAGPRKVAIRGFVFRSDLTPLSNVEVQIIFPSQIGSKHVYTASDGAYSLSLDNPPGSFVLTFFLLGFHTLKVPYLSSLFGQRDQQINIIMLSEDIKLSRLEQEMELETLASLRLIKDPDPVLLAHYQEALERLEVDPELSKRASEVLSAYNRDPRLSGGGGGGDDDPILQPAPKPGYWSFPQDPR